MLDFVALRLLNLGIAYSLKERAGGCRMSGSPQVSRSLCPADALTYVFLAPLCAPFVRFESELYEGLLTTSVRLCGAFCDRDVP